MITTMPAGTNFREVSSVKNCKNGTVTFTGDSSGYSVTVTETGKKGVVRKIGRDYIPAMVFESDSIERLGGVK